MLIVGSLAVAFSLFVLGFYLGKQIGQTAHIRDQLHHTRHQRQSLQSIKLDRASQ